MQSNKKQQWFIALDGGGTRTRAAICNASGRIAAMSVGDATNPLSRPWEAVESTIRELVRDVIDQAGIENALVSALYLGLAGADRPEIKDRLREAFTDEWGERLLLDNDAVSALYAGTWGGPGIVLIGGTGSIAYTVTADEQRQRTGGWGYLIGDEGSGFDIGRRAAAAVMQAADGRGKPTALTDLYLAHFGVNRPEELIARIYGGINPRKELADTSTLVEKAAGLGDEVSTQLIAHAADDLVELASASLRKVGSPLPVVLAGGLLTADTMLRREVLRRAWFAVKIPTVAPVIGALVAAMRRTGRHIDAEIASRLEQSGTVRKKE
ncbi:N-acetylglucosamine kinase [Brevibacillus choshinensis]|uniref:N-acetylglucosamine kinase n=1 Tax=Brevibacillus choshinensis TaxID=54911 RepID=A0ABR5N9T4_BRECH|nr:BadF/BadG/BcrA/BcrD ATPase family protein [Brevibacillus choshinensis]KQL48317.1 N-acetylglucosamine kinase [Brevibacillus choshinensis]